MAAATLPRSQQSRGHAGADGVVFNVSLVLAAVALFLAGVFVGSERALDLVSVPVVTYNGRTIVQHVGDKIGSLAAGPGQAGTVTAGPLGPSAGPGGNSSGDAADVAEIQRLQAKGWAIEWSRARSSSAPPPPPPSRPSWPLFSSPQAYGANGCLKRHATGLGWWRIGNAALRGGGNSAWLGLQMPNETARGCSWTEYTSFDAYAPLATGAPLSLLLIGDSIDRNTVSFFAAQITGVPQANLTEWLPAAYRRPPPPVPPRDNLGAGYTATLGGLRLSNLFVYGSPPAGPYFREVGTHRGEEDVDKVPIDTLPRLQLLLPAWRERTDGRDPEIVTIRLGTWDLKHWLTVEPDITLKQPNLPPATLDAYEAHVAAVVAEVRRLLPDTRLICLVATGWLGYWQWYPDAGNYNKPNAEAEWAKMQTTNVYLEQMNTRLRRLAAVLNVLLLDDNKILSALPYDAPFRNDAIHPTQHYSNQVLSAHLNHLLPWLS